MTILQKIDRVRDLAMNEAYDTIRFTNGDGTTGKIEITGDQSAKMHSLEKALLRAGADLPHNQVERNQMLKECINASCPVYELRDRTGWTDDHKTFVFPFSAISNRSTTIRGVSKNRLPSGILPPGVSGTLESWRKEVASIVACSSVGMTVLSAVFAAPLISILRNTTSFGLCIHAGSRTGKTSLLVAAASALGAKNGNELAKWLNTPTGLRQLMACANDGPLLIDDLNAIVGRPKDVDSALSELARTIESGSGTNRDGKYARKTGAGHDRWRCILMTSFETSLTSAARAAGRERQQGEVIRLIDVPAVSSKKPLTVFDRPAKGGRAPTPADLYKACDRNHGVAFRVYAELLIKKNRKAIEKRALSAMKVFLKRANISTASPAILDIAKKFALIYAGGILATEFKVTGWSEKALLTSLLRVFSRIKRTFPDERANFRAAVAGLDTAIRALPRKRDLSTDAFRTADGYRIVTKSHQTCVMLSEAFNRMLPDATLRQRVANELTRCSVLRTKKLRKSSPTNFPGQSQITWPDKERRRSYRFVIPRNSGLTSILGLTKKKS